MRLSIPTVLPSFGSSVDTRSAAERSYRAAIRAIQEERDSSANKGGASGRRRNAGLRLTPGQCCRAQGGIHGGGDSPPDLRILQRSKIDAFLAIADGRGAGALQGSAYR